MTRPARLIVSVLPGLCLLLVWQAYAQWRPDSDFFVGSPRGIAREVRATLAGGLLLRDFGVTAVETILGFLAGSFLGTLVGLLLWASQTVFLISRPYLVALGSLPVFALAPVVIFWLGTGIGSKVLIGFLSTFVVAVLQAHTGAADADPNLLRLTRAFGGSRRDQFVRIVAPSAAIWVLAGIRLNIGMALLGAFVGEFLASRAGLGHLIIVAQGLYNVDQVWVGVLGIMLIASLFHCLTLPVERWANRWK